jgi:hypothetical protein
MKTRIYAYKNVLGVDTNVEVEGLINDPKSSGQLGMVIRTDAVEITPSAKEMLRNAKREGGSFAPIMLTKHANPDEHGKSSFGVLGFGKAVFSKDDLAIGRECDKSVLDDMTEIGEEQVPEDFKAFVDSNR